MERKRPSLTRSSDSAVWTLAWNLVQPSRKRSKANWRLALKVPTRRQSKNKLKTSNRSSSMARPFLWSRSASKSYSKRLKTNLMRFRWKKRIAVFHKILLKITWISWIFLMMLRWSSAKKRPKKPKSLSNRGKCTIFSCSTPKDWSRSPPSIETYFKLKFLRKSSTWSNFWISWVVKRNRHYLLSEPKTLLDFMKKLSRHKKVLEIIRI